MGSGDKHLLNNLHLHLHLRQHLLSHGGGGGGGGAKKDHHQHNNCIPKGCLAVMVGKEGEEQQRFVVPVAYLNHPLFMNLLKEAEDEYGFDQKGAIAIPCRVADFRYVQGMIDREHFYPHSHGSSHHVGHGHHNLVGCFRV